ncbi:hypothetical protein M413DRAFT_32549 [Hebeloma cylindrosporum]|uniref:Uncharacterized protein n=1 Tax=Hebeloma cylindrosporum TaxID=76867 RepID=A0A0C3BF13_HEBCY|nr:hypothetical protein M413DRAFT_32549 [Hebeloma cylindrosporum h7]
MSEPTWSSRHAGYLQRSEPHSKPLKPIRSALELGVLRNSQVDDEGIDLAIFSDTTVIDSEGGIVILKEYDFPGIMELALLVNNLPKANGFLEPVASPARPNGSSDRWDFVRWGGAFAKSKGEVQVGESVGGFTTLPPLLWELVGLAMEAREYEPEEDVVVLEILKGILGNIY